MRTLSLATALLTFALAAPAGAATLATDAAPGSLGFRVQLENPYVLAGEPVVHALATLEAPRTFRGRDRAVNLSLVIDRSGSMLGQAIADARDAAMQMVDRLRDGDRVSIVSYSDDVRVDVPSVVLGPRTRERVKDAIRRIGPNGWTNLSGGLVAGQAEVRAHLDSDKVNRVILISDGLANRGVTALPALNRIAREALQEGIVTTTLGLGANYNEDLMTAVADHGGGNYYFVQDSKEIAGVLSGEIGQMMATVARQVALEITLPEGVAVDEVFGYAWQQEGPTVVVRLGDVFAGQRRAVLLRLRVAERRGTVALGSLGVRYQDLTADGARRGASEPLAVTVTTDSALVERSRDKEVEARIAEIELATSMQRAAALVQEGRFDDARRELSTATDKARAKRATLGSAGKGLADSADEAADLVEQLAAPPASAEEQKVMTKSYKAGAYKLQKK
ncbi:MAG: VWA domain-containing protein [Deltaproteobacteria bacterium]|nr:VWA domain-containing protein [Deltaproteobacteria bacterium]